MSLNEEWTNEKILRHFLKAIVTHIYNNASQLDDVIREAVEDANPIRLRDRLVTLQLGVVLEIFRYLDDREGPDDWPGIMLVNAESGDRLSHDLTWAYSEVEGEYLKMIDN